MNKKNEAFDPDELTMLLNGSNATEEEEKGYQLVYSHVFNRLIMKNNPIPLECFSAAKEIRIQDLFASKFSSVKLKQGAISIVFA